MIMERYIRINMENMNNSELLKIIEQLKKENKEKDEMLIKKDKEIQKRDKRILVLEAEKRKLNRKIEALIAKYEDKLQVNRKILADTYASKSEKTPKEYFSINEVEVIEEKTRKKPTERFIEELKGLQSEVVILDYDFVANEVDRANVKPFGKDETYKIEMKPLSYKVVKIERPKYKDKEHIYQAISNDPYPHSPLTSSLAANIIEMKYNLGVPLYRYAKYMNAFGLNVSPQDLSNYVMKTMELLNPLYLKLEKALINTPYKVIHGDETTLEVIDSIKTKCYMFVYTTSFWDNAVYIYKFSETRKIDNTIELLNDFNGYYECDGYPGYDALPNKVLGKIKIQRCWAHIRRYFNDCIKSIAKSKRDQSIAFKVSNKINEMFKYESMMKDNEYSKFEIEEFRNGNEYQKVIQEIDKLILNIDYGSNSMLKKAVEHYKNDKDELYTFLENGYIDISNNLAERTVKPFVIARKNFMFCKTSDGAEVTGKLFSIIQTARANGIKTEEYLKYVIDNINKKDINELLPWSENIKNKFMI